MDETEERGCTLHNTSELEAKHGSSSPGPDHPAIPAKLQVHAGQQCPRCSDLFVSVSANLEVIHAPVDGTPGSKQIRVEALAKTVEGLRLLLVLAQNGCRPGGNIGKVTLSLLFDVYDKHRRNIDVQRTLRNLRRPAYDLRILFSHLYDPAPALISLGHRRGLGYDLTHQTGSLLHQHLQRHGLTVDDLHASISLLDLIVSRRGLEDYLRGYYELSVHDLPLIRKLRPLPVVQIGLDRSPAWFSHYNVNIAQTPLHVQVLDALGWTAGFDAAQLMTLTVLLPEWEGTTRELLDTARLL